MEELVQPERVAGLRLLLQVPASGGSWAASFVARVARSASPRELSRAQAWTYPMNSSCCIADHLLGDPSRWRRRSSIPWMPHSKLSKVWVVSATMTWNAFVVVATDLTEPCRAASRQGERSKLPM
jgi:hypothetical protein